jgi:endonuclease/exonuclease/phosphatase family metal-dependent hydrolase
LTGVTSNALAGGAPLARLRATKHFIGFDDVPTFPARAATRRIDYVLAPNTWTLIEQHVVDIGTSDHLAVVATFRLP